MKNYSTSDFECAIGLDLGDKASYFMSLGAEDREVVEEGKVVTTPRAIEKKFRLLARSRIALEAGAHSGWVSRLLMELGHEVIVANPRKLRLIYENKSKNDRVDASYLARVALLAPELLAPICHRGAQAQVDLQLLRAREKLVKARSMLITFVRASVKQTGARLPGCSADSFVNKVQSCIPLQLRPALEPLLQMIQGLSEQIGAYDAVIEAMCRDKYPETQSHRQVGGVGPQTALAYVLTLEDWERFENSRIVGAYVGLCPGKKQSGDRDPQQRITRQGNSYLRRLLIHAAHYIMGPFGKDCDLRRHGEKIAARGGKAAKKRAIVAVARKLAVLLHHLWKSGDTYDPLYNAKRGKMA